MSDQHYEPVKTALGILRGRDAIILWDLSFNPIGNVLNIKGDINGNLSTTPEYRDQTIDFIFVCSGVIAFTLTDNEMHLDEGVSCFDEVIDSEWMEKIGQDNSKCKHYVMTFYDHTLDIICDHYQLDLTAMQKR